VNKLVRNTKERWNATETPFGRFLSRQLAVFLLVCTAIGGSMEYLSILPPDWIPVWIQKIVPVAGFISFVAGRLTKKKDGQPEEEDQGESV
jgi:hypothetical protein